MATQTIQATTITGRTLPLGWRIRERRDDGAAYIAGNGMTAIESISMELDGNRWHHLSIAFHDHLPSYEDLAMAKRIFMGVNATALQVFAPASKHVNVHPYCLHLWRCLDSDVTPDFTRGGASI